MVASLCFVSLGDTKDYNDIAGQWQDEWLLDTWVYSLIFLWLRVIFLPMLVNKYVEYPKPDHDDASREAVLPGTECKEQALPNGRSPLQAVQFCPLPGQVRHVKWWLTKYFADHADVFHLWAEMGNDECTGVKLKI